MNTEMRKALLEQLLKVVGQDRVKGFGVELESPEGEVEMEGPEEDKAEGGMEEEGEVCKMCGAKKMACGGKVTK